MSLLLDTHVLVWLAEGSAELSPAARETIEEAAREGGLAVSSISFWEVAMLEAAGRITLSLPVRAWREKVVAALGEEVLDGDLLVESVHLPGGLHADPADRILVATARARGHRLATRDRRLLDYGAAGHLQTLAV